MSNDVGNLGQNNDLNQNVSTMPVDGRISSVVQSSIKLINLMVKSNADTEKLKSALNSLKNERELEGTLDHSRDAPIGKLASDLTERVEFLIDWIIKKEKCRNGNQGIAPARQMVEDELFDVSDYEEDLLTTTISRQCNICGRMLGSRTSLRQHKMLHLEDPRTKVLKPYECDTCEVTFFCQSALTKHKLTHLDKNDPARLAAMLECDSCHLVLSTRHSLTRHKLTHLDRNDPARIAKPVTCDICGKTTSTQYNMAAHKKTHLAKNDPYNRRFKCQECSKHFRSGQGLRRHRSIHTGEYPFACDQCPKKFTNSGNYKRHKKMHESASGSEEM
ncbi:hypothetical protein PRIPAC_85489 [Pristionchus pacificus]|uniref:Zinc finger protein n=1 Tax=Pristionchus pacificus TaxID=54126 RepID=A0A2A6BT52_PRIPA|nr:hypothetical protein PRIPAC_85489 [Pristionchus pacificus]|eukprot:PDM68983.1 zinc finger protein [Pristionchus pacificus]